MAAKSEILLGHIIDIKENVAGINQHLKDMNGRLVAHDKIICAHESKINRIDKKIAGWAGGIAAVLFIFNIIISKIL